MGFKYAACGPLVRSSYKAGEFYLASVIRGGFATFEYGSSPQPSSPGGDGAG
jgi:hypothetical protein